MRKAEGWSGARPWPDNGPGFKGQDYIVAADVRNQTGIASNRLKVERNGSQIKAYANGQLLKSISDSSYTGLTQVGLLVSSYGSSVDVRFDNFLVTCAGTSVSGVATESSVSGRPPSGKDLPGGWIDSLRHKGN